MRVRSLAAWSVVAALIGTAGCLAKRDSSGGGSGVNGAGGGAEISDAGGSSHSGGADGATSGCSCAAAATAANESCEYARVECEYDPYCLDWLGCFEDCSAAEWTAACLDACEASHPGAAGMAYSIVQCVCATCTADPTCTAGCQ